VSYATEDLSRSFDAETLKRGQFYFLNHRVINVEVHPEFGVSAEVVEERLPCAVTLRLTESRGERFLEGACSCLERQNCKHAAAVALFLRQAQDDKELAQDIRGLAQDIRGLAQDIRGLAQDIRGEAILLPVVDLDDDTELDPIPVLRLGKGPSAELLFDYDGQLVRPDNARPLHLPFERYCIERLRKFGLAYADRDRWLHFSNETLPQLREDGWRIEIDPAFPYRIVAAGDDWRAEVYDGASSQWFELELGVDVEGKRVSLLPLLIDALRRSGLDLSADAAALARLGKPLLGKLPNGAYVALAPERVARVLSTLAGLFGDDGTPRGERARIPMLRAAALRQAQDDRSGPQGAPRQAEGDNNDSGLTFQWAQAQSVRALFDDINSSAQRPIALPTTFVGTLRPYQRDGVAWLQALRAHGLGGILADDMGLGKTVQMLAHIAIEHAAGRLAHPVLVIAPTSVVPNWRAEIARFLPTLPPEAIELSSYALLARDPEPLVAREWSIVVLDEAQFIKNPRTKAAVGARRLRAQQTIAMSGTPIENHLEELWSIYAFAVPGLLPERARFARFFRMPIERRADVDRRRALAARVRPFLMRRTKERVAQELPEKTAIVQRVELSGAQRDLYETIRLAMHLRVREEIDRRGLERSRIIVLDALLKLRQVCCDPRLLKLPAAAVVKESHKLDALLEMLDSLLADGRRVLLFSQFTSMLDIIQRELTKRHMPYVELRGSTKDRQTPVARFQSGEVPLFLISLKAGGTGLNLTAADTVIHYDPWWNPAVERQATDRAHRIGQQQHVFVYSMIAQDTVEERILELQERKGALAASLFDDSANEKLELNAAELERLFS
jgi:superfamily II DNA or RNA helicase